MSSENLVQIKGRGATYNPPNRFEAISVEVEEEHAEGVPLTTYYRDTTRTIIARNNSPDVGFEASVNVYRGCSHGCSYCFARPFHEMLGLSAGLDFESKIFVKEDAPELLEAALASPRWKPELVVMSGVTDPYQPAEKVFRLTRRCLEVFARFRNPVSLITKNALILRDLDLLSELASYSAVSVAVSITTMKRDLQKKLEPRASSPSARLEAVRRLSESGIPVTVMVAPVIPGLTDDEIPAILKACAEAGAQSAGYVALRLPGAVAEIFDAWVSEHYPERAKRVLNRVREMRGGRLYNPKWGERMSGTGVYAQHIETMFNMWRTRCGLDRKSHELSTEHFMRPGQQLALF